MVVAIATACAPASLVKREHVFEPTMAEVDALALQLLPPRARDCGVHGEPADLPFVARVWPATDCISAALAARQPFVVRYRGMTMDSGTETAFAGTGDAVYRIYEDRTGPFTLESCSRVEVRVTSHDGVTCRRWLLVRDLRKQPG
jgi:hypothetical protein